MFNWLCTFVSCVHFNMLAILGLKGIYIPLEIVDLLQFWKASFRVRALGFPFLVARQMVLSWYESVEKSQRCVLLRSYLTTWKHNRHRWGCTFMVWLFFLPRKHTITNGPATNCVRFFRCPTHQLLGQCCKHTISISMYLPIYSNLLFFCSFSLLLFTSFNISNGFIIDTAKIVIIVLNMV